MCLAMTSSKTEIEAIVPPAANLNIKPQQILLPLDDNTKGNFVKKDTTNDSN